MRVYVGVGECCCVRLSACASILHNFYTHTTCACARARVCVRVYVCVCVCVCVRARVCREQEERVGSPAATSGCAEGLTRPLSR